MQNSTITIPLGLMKPIFQGNLKPLMRTIAWLSALLVDIGIIALYAPSAFSGDVIALAVIVLFGAVGALLIAVRFWHIASWGYAAMKAICIIVPIAASAGSLDSG